MWLTSGSAYSVREGVFVTARHMVTHLLHSSGSSQMTRHYQQGPRPKEPSSICLNTDTALPELPPVIQRHYCANKHWPIHLWVTCRSTRAILKQAVAALVISHNIQYVAFKTVTANTNTNTQQTHKARTMYPPTEFKSIQIIRVLEKPTNSSIVFH
ncbi:hypothetical protein JOB18_021151 [Solea senegalensis]|uniref:Uncharacterized protein n=1 Tax=Solea senegalensis TaxID=28829 RepID=A0AAV6Q226_SOLSE|nr:hypothetical protein JOB18_021151 [Solea senegalensis]